MFFNYRGLDVKDLFVKKLYEGFWVEGVCVFLDVYDIECGKKIWNVILEVIRVLLVCICVFLLGYVEFSWCFDEFVVIYCSSGK